MEWNSWNEFDALTDMKDLSDEAYIMKSLIEILVTLRNKDHLATKGFIEDSIEKCCYKSDSNFLLWYK